MDKMVLILEIIGIIAYSVSGAITALKKKMDLFGVIIMGCITATGGGVLRDLILGKNPPTAFVEPVYVSVAIITSIIVFLPHIKKILINSNKIIDNVFLVMDTIGLGVFTVTAIKSAYIMGYADHPFLIVSVGLITGIAGGVMRDVISGNVPPNVFVKHFYATASIVGGVLYVILYGKTGNYLCGIISAMTIIILRFCAAYFHWEFFKYK